MLFRHGKEVMNLRWDMTTNSTSYVSRQEVVDCCTFEYRQSELSELFLCRSMSLAISVKRAYI